MSNFHRIRQFRNKPKAAKAERAAQVCAALSGVAFLISALVFLCLGHWPVTHLDFWRIYEVCLKYSWLESALQKFNNHSLFFPSFIWLADLRFFHGDQQLVFFAGMTLLFLTVAFLLVPLWRDKTLSLTARIAVTLVLIVSNFWMGRSAIIASGGFNCIGSFSMAGTVLAFLYLPAMTADAPHHWRATLIVLAATFVASLSASSGLATWPALLFLGWCMRLPWRSLGIITIAAVVTAIIFALVPSPLPLLVASPAGFSLFTNTTLQELCRLLGSPILSAKMAWHVAEIPQGAVESSLFSLCVGAAGLVLTAVIALPRLIRRDLRQGGMEFMGLALVTSNVFVMIIIVVGRASLMHVIPSEVAAPRYFFWSTLFWAGLLMIAIQRAESNRWLRSSVLLGALLTLVFAFPRHMEEGARYRYAAKLAESGAISLVNGACDVEEVKILFPDPKQIYRVAEQLRARRLDMFAQGLQDWPGLRESGLFGGRHKPEGLKGKCSVAALVQCEGGVPAARVTGSARKRHNVVPRTLVIVDSNGVIRGVGRSFTTNAFINRLFYQGKFPGTAFLCYIRDYDAGLQYVVRSADDGKLSDESIVVEKPVPGVLTP
jgi:hypothetical protein